LRIAVTGAEGFTGQHFAAAARAAGHEVVPLASNLTDAAALRSEVASASFDAVVHLAAIAFVAHRDDRALYDVNLFGTLNLLEALAGMAQPPHRVLLASSANVYGNWGERPIPEDLAPAPVNHYAMSKLAMEHMARTYLGKLPIVFARPFNYTGPGQSPDFVIPKLVRHFQEKAPLVRLGNLEVEREYNDVRFVCEAYLRLLQADIAPGGVFNVCTGRPHRLLAVIDTLAQLTGHEIRVESDPAFVRPNEVHRLCGDPSRLRAAVGALPAHTLEQTLGWMLRATA
jgi:nucleoside-diphosphate-sugar epimerase